MSIRGIDGRGMVQKAPEVAKIHSDQTNRQDAFQKALAEQGKAKAEQSEKQVPIPEESHGPQMMKEHGERSSGRQNKSASKEASKKDSEDEEQGADKTKGVRIDVRI